MTEAEFDALFEDEDFRKEMWVLIMLYLFIKDVGADTAYKTFFPEGNPFKPKEE